MKDEEEKDSQKEDHVVFMTFMEELDDLDEDIDKMENRRNITVALLLFALLTFFLAPDLRFYLITFLNLGSIALIYFLSKIDRLYFMRDYTDFLLQKEISENKDIKTITIHIHADEEDD